MSSDFSLENLKIQPIPGLIADPLLSDHRWLLTEFDRLLMLLSQLQAQQSSHQHLPGSLGSHLQQMQAGLAHHIDREERVVFPAVIAGNADEVRGTIRDLELDHHVMEEALAKVRELTGDLSVPADASVEWKDLYASLATLEARIQRHAQIEDQILFPRVFFEQPDSMEPGEGSR